jgi:hypothetical protein
MSAKTFLMKSKDRLDPSRLRVDDVRIAKVWDPDGNEGRLEVTLTLLYDTWWGSTRDCDVLAEYAGALQCVQRALREGGVEDE